MVRGVHRGQLVEQIALNDSFTRVEGGSLNSFSQQNLCISKLIQFAFVVLIFSAGAGFASAAEEHGGDDHKADADHADSDNHGHESGDHSHGAEAGHSDHGDAHGDGHDDHHGEGHGPPSIWEDLSFWSIIAFAGFCGAIVKLGLWDSLVTNMTAREEAEVAAIEKAEGGLAEAKTVLGQCRGQLEAMDETVAEILAEAKRDAAHTETDIIEAANHEASLMVQRAELEIERTKDQSLNRLFSHLAERVAEATESKLKTQLQTGDQDKLIDETLGQLAAK